MRREIKSLAKESLINNGPVLSVFINLRDEDHSYKKIRSILISAQKELAESGKSIKWLDKVLADQFVSGAELGIREGLSDTNLALYAIGEEFFSFRVERELDEAYFIADVPVIVPAISNNLSGIKTILIDRKAVAVYGFENNVLRVLANNFLLLDNDVLENFDNQMVQDRTKKRTDELIKSYLKNTIHKIQTSCLKNSDQVIVYGPADFIPYIKKNFESSIWKKNYLCVKHNFQSFNVKNIEKFTKDIVAKNKLGQFKPLKVKNEKNYNSLNTIKKELSVSNIRSFFISEDYLLNFDFSHSESIEFNNYLCDLAANGVDIQVLKGMEKNFSTQVFSFDEGKAFTQP